MFDSIRKIFSRPLADFSGLRILVVEDNDLDRKLIVNILEKSKAEVITAKDGAEGLNLAQDSVLDAIVLDCEMPVLTGIEMCRRLKEQPQTQGIPVLFLTGIKTPANVIECFDADAESYLEKPVNSEILISELESLIKRNK